MSLPGLSNLPGLGSASLELSAPTVAVPRVYNLNPETELRFESSFSNPINIKLVYGNAEIFGTELAPNTTYTLKGAKAAVYTWYGCRLEITGCAETVQVGEQTPMLQYINTHGALEDARESAQTKKSMGPRVLIVGAENAGKTSLAKMLTAYAIKSDRQPIGVNLDPSQALLSVPGALTASTFASLLDVEEGWGSSPISGPSALPIKMPLCYHFGCKTAESNPKLYKSLVTRLALAVTSRMEADEDVRSSGCIIDTPGSLTVGENGNYDLLQHIVSEFSVNAILFLGEDALYNKLQQQFNGPEVTIAQLDKSTACFARSQSYMKEFRQQQIRDYFFGHGSITLSPLTTQTDFGNLSIYRINDSTTPSPHKTENYDEDDAYEPTVPQPPTTTTTPSNQIYEKITPSNMMQNSLLAVTNADSNASQEEIRDASVMGYVYVAGVEEGSRKIRLLSPVGGKVPAKAIIWGSWPEEVVDLVG
ncbi:mRNA cleavage and polyadenylation factor IA/II complex [Tothia fuscella]|uniref:Polynucleotide 5'-hydroxyl-kinase GRC3 n=1 Tax=Tothia fuscella TaxID=1048955 RepID=A0A9P4NJE3_9PEZI|nr:mRNA cleavage and polyadenylation factor IA/II complex [Tothia fuscella]